ncbi:protein N-lysine methyltransferase METTL21D-like isoform X1 [Neodiprion pinetum]|uniref:Protein N-lysine methyltransferase METTL21D isoform X1 n=1 Tax=Neodiprion lecontei TaxID=441921 RepID=A0A6J0C7J0_NEOLC|nr:protein N-lysine methyltransferase METTL21D isoform X1 [Neodiprion lecontei]XP_015522598.1 protein N-lysine methyltransferase METTL21D isoform X1 [Neodiprion lecontei]XP_046489122.1 protein N-lysine methyltransferase METTL21D-like isoform X1 [Neodiprion pinetum]XP_046489130.1 protein N-lysine methyltransferase METTL21D-like isoform X1 [Neodiprion pinetum]XP_046489140.1 protein N-lysine methyltransferase METTL21D-like isoform X1 [Neodiprion pinetum]XP_046489149.1 protein N-lysine methyltrans
MDKEDDVFTREFELESRNVTLTLYQKEVGDVSCVVWDASLVLAKYLDVLCSENRLGKNWLVGKKVLELGAGLGCVGMTAACLGAEVVLTDLANVLPALNKNIEMNKDLWKQSGGSARAEELDWSKHAEIDFKPEIILLADCVYYTESIEPLLDTLERLCGARNDTYALLSQEERDTPNQKPVWSQFVEAIKKRFKITPVMLSEQHPTYSSHDIRVLKLTLPSKDKKETQ